MTVPAVQELAMQYADPDRMIFVVVGDAATQIERLAGLGFGDPIQLDRSGNPTGQADELQ